MTGAHRGAPGRRHLRAAAAGVIALAATSIWAHDAAAQRLELSVTPRTITFPSIDPDAAPVVASAPVQVTYRIRQNASGPWTLTILAGGDLISGSATVDISNVSWVASPAPPFQNGTLSKTVAQRLASGTGNETPARQGQVTFRLANSWTYSAGVYTQVVVFTLTAP
jgi:hypothetical protein